MQPKHAIGRAFSPSSLSHPGPSAQLANCEGSGLDDQLPAFGHRGKEVVEHVGHAHDVEVHQLLTVGHVLDILEVAAHAHASVQNENVHLQSQVTQPEKKVAIPWLTKSQQP